MKPIMVIAGEASGDAHAAAVIRALRGRPVFGAGGPRMKAAGMDLVLDLTEHAVVGLVEVLKNYGKFKRIFDQLLAEVARRQPAAVVLVDFPGFNLRFARAVKERFPGIKVIYYISPQLWAWHARRAKQIERDVDVMLTIFPFEKEWYRHHAPRLRVEFVGHPLADHFPKIPNPEPRTGNVILLLPGSREREVAKIFPVMCRAIAFFTKVERSFQSSAEFGTTRFVAVAATASLARLMQHPHIEVQTGNAHDWMRRAALAITASGTATMECAFFGCPMVVVYKVNWLTYLVGRMVVQVDWLAMPNVIAGQEIVPEFIQQDARPERIAAAASDLLTNPVKREQMQRELASVVRTLGGPGASARAAEMICAEVAS